MRILEFDLGYKKNNTLNPKLWQDGILRPDMKSALIKIAQDFKNYIDVPFDVDDLYITGGQVSYYYTEHSDLDLHLIVDFDNVECDREAEELFDTKRLLYKQRYNITVNGIPVELYVENKDYPAVSSSYSILQDRWIVEPRRNVGNIDRKEIVRMSTVWQKIIDAAIASKDVKTAQKTLSLLRKYRKTGLKTSGEYGVPNLVYKTLRNSKNVEELTTFIDRMHDKDLSI